MRNMLSAAMWNLHGKVCGKPCRNVEKRVLHRWNLVGQRRQAAGSSYLSGKENAVRAIRRKPEQKTAILLQRRSAQLSPNSRTPNRKSRLHRRTGLGRNCLNRHLNNGKIVRRSRISRRLWLQTSKPDRPAERPTVPNKSKTRHTMPKGLDEETFGAEFKQRKTGKITRKQRRSESRGERK